VREKIVAQASRRFVVLVDASKIVDRLGWFAGAGDYSGSGTGATVGSKIATSPPPT